MPVRASATSIYPQADTIFARCRDSPARPWGARLLEELGVGKAYVRTTTMWFAERVRISPRGS
ncbi:protein of unknown function [Candidatus Hydrogenisulfobacillus filiaventi]|uniref:Uncharacterized protein n=1 Tax=Candidatus Hydrogenisulfobacillus filiaventi TaxID=2707344 RepID=A0A6F8ZCT1_9FIRM|nr:protein of unknown function [Candidatus Hydrogenisulfobacillus filiaventi]